MSKNYSMQKHQCYLNFCQPG